jgi:DNA-binding MarR family transcriptional regulator
MAAQVDYERLLQFRNGLRRFLHWSEEQAAGVGLTGAQHQLLLAIRGHGSQAPTVGDVAADLMLRHHSAVGLIDRAVDAGLVERHSDPHDQRVVRLHLTASGAARLQRLSGVHMEELRRMAPTARALWDDLEIASPAS